MGRNRHARLEPALARAGFHGAQGNRRIRRRPRGVPDRGPFENLPMNSGGDSRMRLLVGYADYTDRLSYYDDWRDAFTQAPQFDAVPFNIAASDAKAKLPRMLREVDAVVLLHSTNGDTTMY